MSWRNRGTWNRILSFLLVVAIIGVTLSSDTFFWSLAATDLDRSLDQLSDGKRNPSAGSKVAAADPETISTGSGITATGPGITVTEPAIIVTGPGIVATGSVITVTGSVIDAKTSAPVSCAAIALKGMDTYYTVTNEDGIFTISDVIEESVYQIKITHNDYRTQQMNTPVSHGGIFVKLEQKLLDTGFSFEKNQLDNLVYGDGKEYVNQASGGKGTGSISYSVTSGSSVTVDSFTGRLSVTKAGISVITAQRASDDNYKPVSASYAAIVLLGNDEGFAFEKKNPENFVYGSNYNIFTNQASGGKGTGRIVYTVTSGAINAESKEINNDAAEIIDEKGTLKILKSGVVKVTATREADDKYQSVSTSYLLTIEKGEQKLFHFEEPNPAEIPYGLGQKFENKALGDIGPGKVFYQVIKGDGASVDENGILTILKAGTVTIEAKKEENDQYKEQSISYQLTITRIQQSPLVFEFSNPKPIIYGDKNEFMNQASGGDSIKEVTYQVTSGSAAYVNVLSGKVTPIKAGKVIITAAKEGDNYYEDISASYTLEILKAPQTGFVFKNPTPEAIVFNEDNKLYENEAAGGESIVQEVSYRIISGNDVAEIDSKTGVLSIIKAGDVTVEAMKAGDVCYEDVTTQYTLTILRAKQVIAFSQDSYSFIYGTNFEKVPEAKEQGRFFGTGNIVYEIISGNEIASIHPDTGALTFYDDKVGEVVVKATKAEDERYEKAVAQYTLNVSYLLLPDPEISYELVGKKVNGWFTEKVSIRARDGYQISDSNSLSGSNVWGTELTNVVVNDGIETIPFYVKQGDKITGQISVEIKKDETKPKGRIQINEVSWYDKLLETFSFGFWKKETISVTMEAEDLWKLSDNSLEKNENMVSGVASMEYYITNRTTPMVIQELELLKEWKEYTPFQLEPNNRFVVYGRIIDTAGNVSYLSSDGIIVEETKAMVTFTSFNGEEKKEIYNEDVTIKFTAEDKEVYSGLKEISYWITKADDKGGEEIVTKEETILKTFIYPETPKLEELVAEESKCQFTVNAAENNSDFVTVHVKVVDNAGNEETYCESLSIDITKPEIMVDYDNDKANSIEEGRGYFGSTRVATITIKERTSHFEEEKATKSIVLYAVDASGEPVPISGSAVNVSQGAVYIKDLKWETTEGSSPDQATHTATITYSQDANYTFNMKYTDKANNTSEGFLTGNSVTPTEFTIDKETPNGEIKVGDYNPWHELLETLSFGLWKNEAVDVMMTASDATSPIITEYYISNRTIPMTREELQSVEEWKEYVPFQLNPDNNFVVYGRISDKAGNVFYLSSDGIILERTKPVVTFTAYNGEKVKKEIYNEDVTIGFTVEEPNVYSGLKEISYWVTKADYENEKEVITKEETILKTFTYPEKPKLEDLVTREDNCKFTIKAEENNCDFVKVYVKVVDNAGNEEIYCEKLSIDITEPEIMVDYDNDKANSIEEGRGYFGAARLATITIKERTSHFEEEMATKSIAIYAVDATGKIVPISGSAASVSPGAVYIKDLKWETTEGNKPDAAIHTAKILYSQDANYTFDMVYRDKAGMESKGLITENSITPTKFTVDMSKPNGDVMVDSNEWEEPIESLTFGFWKNGKADISLTASDEISPVRIEYFVADQPASMTEEKLELIEAWKEYVPFQLNPNNRFVVYGKVTDYAGNVFYMSSKGIILEEIEPMVSFTSFNGEEEKKEIYNEDVTIKFTAEDKEVYSGLKEISYWITKADDKGGEEIVTKEETILKTFIYSENPKLEELVAEESKCQFTVNAAENNSDFVTVHVKVVDNAGNEETYCESLSIDITKPEIMVDYNNDKANSIHLGRGYFDSTRVATITIKERTSHFEEEKATKSVAIYAVDASGESVPISGSSINVSQGAVYIKDLKWETTEGSSPDQATHTATITYSQDANYTFNMKYTDKANNTSEGLLTGNSVTPTEFTVDKQNPSGTVKVDTNSFSSLLWSLTFKLWKSEPVNVTMTGNDATSPVIIEYFKTSDTIQKTEDQLNRTNSWAPYVPFQVNPEERFVIYVRIKDYAGNSIYLNSDGFVVDKKAPVAIILPEKANEKGLYNKSVNVSVSVEDPGIYSGLRSVRYQVFKDDKVTQGFGTGDSDKGILYDFSNTNPTYEQLNQKWEGSIKVDGSKNNSNNVKVFVIATDNAGNIFSNSISLSIDTTSPVIKVTYNNNKESRLVNKRGYFAGNRTATVSITERTVNFDKADATKGIRVTGVDGKNQSIKLDQIISSFTTVEGATPDAAVHTAKITYSADANYTFDITYTDKAGNVVKEINYGDSVSPNIFTVDKIIPTGTIKVGDYGVWDKLIGTLTFGLWSKKSVVVTGTSQDQTSPMDPVVYYKTANTAAMTKSQLDALSEASWSRFNSVKVGQSEQFTVYTRLRDYADNYKYLSTNGIVVDNKVPTEELIPEITINPEQPINEIYNRDVNVEIHVVDPITNGAYSGLNQVSYEVLNMGTVTQQGVLYQFEIKNPTKEQLKQKWDGKIKVDSTLNNSNNVEIKVYAIDNAGNQSDKNSLIKIDITKPTIQVTYDNNLQDGEFSGYFKEERRATVLITERNFKPEEVEVKITNTETGTPVISGFSTVKGSGNEDDTIHTATISYIGDGDYTFEIAYKDMASNENQTVDYGGSITPVEFTIDKTIPTLNVSFDNTKVLHNNFYQDKRVATISIKEHNFESGRAIVEVSASDDEKKTAPPSVSAFTSQGDLHTATIVYEKDGLYTLHVDYTDKAGNKIENFEKTEFYVDQTAPELSITGVKNQSANKDDVIPVIRFADTNYDPSKVSIVLTGSKLGEVKLDGSYKEIHNGRIFTFRNFEKIKEMDDLYTLKATLTDKAGNTSTETIIFSVNRFGSTYTLDDTTSKINGSFITAGADVIITETNVNPLSPIQVTLFKDNTTKILKEKEDYSVSHVGGTGSWNQYTYTIFKKNFEEDGVYRVQVYSLDSAKNESENTMDTKGTEIGFGVDKTSPMTVISDLEDNITYPVEYKPVIMAVSDNLKLSSVKVELDGRDHKVWKEEEVDEFLSNQNDFDFDIPGDSKEAHIVKVMAYDAAGNESITEIKDFYVTTDLWVRFYNNKPLFYGSIGGAAFFLIAVTGLITLVQKRRKKKAEKN